MSCAENSHALSENPLCLSKSVLCVQCLENEMGSIVLGRYRQAGHFQHLLSLHIVYDILSVFENIKTK